MTVFKRLLKPATWIRHNYHHSYAIIIIVIIVTYFSYFLSLYKWSKKRDILIGLRYITLIYIYLYIIKNEKKRNLSRAFCIKYMLYHTFSLPKKKNIYILSQTVSNNFYYTIKFIHVRCVVQIHKYKTQQWCQLRKLIWIIFQFVVP